MDKTLSDRIKEAMREAKVSPKELADACGVKVQAVYQWRSGATKTLEGSNLVTAAELLGVRSQWLADGKGPRIPGENDPEAIGHSHRLKKLIHTLERLETTSPLLPDLVGALQMTVDVFDRASGGALAQPSPPSDAASNDEGFTWTPAGLGLSLEGIEPWDDNTPLGPDEIAVPFYKEVEFAAGSGRTPGLEITDRKIRFGTRSLEAAGADPDAVLCALNKGKSMEDLIQDRAMIAIDTSKKKVSDGFIYAFSQDEELRVKYLYNLEGGGLRIVSHNPDKHEFPDEELGPGWKKRIAIIGWVWTWSPPIRRWKEK